MYREVYNAQLFIVHRHTDTSVTLHSWLTRTGIACEYQDPLFGSLHDHTQYARFAVLHRQAIACSTRLGEVQCTDT